MALTRIHVAATSAWSGGALGPKVSGERRGDGRRRGHRWEAGSEGNTVRTVWRTRRHRKAGGEDKERRRRRLEGGDDAPGGFRSRGGAHGRGGDCAMPSVAVEAPEEVRRRR